MIYQIMFVCFLHPCPRCDRCHWLCHHTCSEKHPMLQKQPGVTWADGNDVTILGGGRQIFCTITLLLLLTSYFLQYSVALAPLLRHNMWHLMAADLLHPPSLDFLLSVFWLLLFHLLMSPLLWKDSEWLCPNNKKTLDSDVLWTTPPVLLQLKQKKQMISECSSWDCFLCCCLFSLTEILLQQFLFLYFSKKKLSSSPKAIWAAAQARPRAMRWL